MPIRPPIFRPHGQSTTMVRREYEARRREQKPWRAFYKTAAWQRIRERRLAEDPLCRLCLARGEVTPADTVNHILRHGGDGDLFFDYENTEAVCKRCHDVDVQRSERRARKDG